MSVRCLIVDDNPHLLRAAADLLERAGLAVVGVASTAAQARQACRQLQPDIVLVDVDLGDESGFEVARQIAGQPGGRQVCVTLISAHSASDFAEMAAELPGVSFLPKDALSGDTVLSIVAKARGMPRQSRHRDSR